MGMIPDPGIPYLTIDMASGMLPTGTGSLTAVSASALRLTGSDADESEDVTIANGETKVIALAATPGAYVRVSRTSASSLAGSTALSLALLYGNAVGFDDVTDAESAAGDDEVRCLAILNGGVVPVLDVVFTQEAQGTQAVSDAAQLAASGAGTLETTDSFADWPETGFCRIRTAAAAEREVVYYSERTDTVLTVPAAGRAQLGTSAGGGAVDDTLDAISGMRFAREIPSPGAAAFTGAGLNDATYGGGYKGQTDRVVKVKVTTTGTPDLIQYSVDDGVTYNGTDIEMTGSAQDLLYGVQITFGATTGHTLNDLWESTCTAKATDKTGAGEGSVPAGLTWSYASVDAGDLAVGEQVFLWLRRAVTAGHVATGRVLHDLRMTFSV